MSGQRLPSIEDNGWQGPYFIGPAKQRRQRLPSLPEKTTDL